MPPKGGNAKKESGRAKKAENEAKKQEAVSADKERKESSKWQDGAKAKKAAEDKEEKRKAELARKAENARLLAEEEASAPSKPKAAPKAGAKKTAPKAVKPAGPGAIAAGGGLSGASLKDERPRDEKPEEPETFSATGLDNALDLLEVVTAKMDKASVGQRAAGIEQHPERRFKATFEAYKERELPNIRADVQPDDRFVRCLKGREGQRSQSEASSHRKSIARASLMML
ncbi:hypothetical protein PHLCEN_2v10834 [Hermanssonia centrifuga]|uniref:Uncharacterized protein n=1 Tax=Hermanssonia centrifuga TaxID=98765 RepID=A0A2R6NLU6_9APHY|nr:hypothetical protein PHLCEN_2v10834 [Hermanssonia centrifuga]